jgi:transcriptional regulator with XRE-family HTH domain
MKDLELGRLLRMLRMRRHSRLADVEARIGLSAESLGRHERGRFTSLDRLRRHAAEFDLRIELAAIGRGAEIPRLRDDEHAAIVNLLAATFGGARWLVEPEASYSEWGERGRIDLLARLPQGPNPILAVVEVKTDFGDLQQLLGSSSVKERLAPMVATKLGWPAQARVVTVIAAASTSRNHELVTDHAALFASFRSVRFRRAVPDLAKHSRVLLWVPAAAAGRQQWLAGRRRVSAGRPRTARVRLPR